MLGIEQICKTIKNLFNNTRPPFKQISRILLICSAPNRPGLSVIHSVAKITNDLAKLGIPTGSMPDGSPNLTIGVMFAATKEQQRAMKHDAMVQIGTAPGSMDILGQATGPFGTAIVTGKNASAGMSSGVIS